MNKLFSQTGWDDFMAWVREDRKIAKKIHTLLKDIERNGMENVAFSEPPMMELIEGKVFMMSPRPQPSHNMIITHITRIFDNYLWDKPCVVFSDGVDVYLDEQNHYIPDVMIVCNRDIIKQDAIHGAPPSKRRSKSLFMTTSTSTWPTCFTNSESLIDERTCPR